MDLGAIGKMRKCRKGESFRENERRKVKLCKVKRKERSFCREKKIS